MPVKSKAGIQQNNGSPLGQGQTMSGKQVSKPTSGNFMEDAFGQDMMQEQIAPGIPTAEMGSALNVKPPKMNMGANLDVPGNPFSKQSGSVGQMAPVNGTMPIPNGRGPMQPAPQIGGIPQTFQGQGTGWRGLDLTPTTFSGNNPMIGFNHDRAFSGADNDSVKDTFARFANSLPSLRGQTKDQIGQMFTSNLDRARSMGLNILDVQGDKILIDAKEHGPRWVDAVSDAGGQNPDFAWQVDDQGASGAQANMAPRSAPAGDIYNNFQSQLMQTQQSQNDSSSQLDDLLAYLMGQNQEQI